MAKKTLSKVVAKPEAKDMHRMLDSKMMSGKKMKFSDMMRGKC